MLTGAIAFSLKTLFNTNPMPMSLSILAVSVVTAIMIFKKTLVSWMAFVFILTFASGMMTLFIYVASLTPNEKMKTKKSNWILLMTILLIPIPFSDPTAMKSSMKMFSNQYVIVMMALIILFSMLAIALQGHNPNQTAVSNF